MLTANKVTPNVCMVCKKYVGDGNLCDDPKCVKIMESQFHMIFNQLHKRTANADHIRETLAGIIESIKINAEIMKSDYNKDIDILCKDENAVKDIMKSIKYLKVEDDTNMSVDDGNTLISIHC